MNKLFGYFNQFARVAIVLPLAIVFFNCSFTNNNSLKDAQRVLLILNFPIVYPDGHLVNLTDSIYITFFGKTILYQLPVHHSIEDEEKILFRELRFSGFVFNKDDKYGYLFSSVKDSIGKKLLVDSFLKRKSADFLNIDDVVRESTLTSSFLDSSTSILTQVYASKEVMNESYNDTVYLCFTKRNRLIDLSFSRKIDSVMNLTLIKARFLFNEKYSDTYKIKLPKREMTIQVYVLKDEITSEVQSFFNLFTLMNSKNDRD